MATMYDNMKFPDYEFREYPKRVGDKRYMNREEEEADKKASEPPKNDAKTDDKKSNPFAAKS